MLRDEFHTIEVSDTVRVACVYDPDYSTVGSYALATDDDTSEAEAAELAKLESGEWVACGMLVFERIEACAACGRDAEWVERDSLWGIVIGTGDEELRKFAEWSLDIPQPA